jgi:O-glycosyl hydrolase
MTSGLILDAQYLFKAIQEWDSKGFPAHAVGIQNEPLNNNPTYPTAVFTASQEAQVAVALRSLLDANGLSGVKIIGYEHNWDNTAFPEAVVSLSPS